MALLLLSTPMVTMAGDVAANQKSSYWVKNDGTLWTWGRNFEYQLGHSNNSQKTEPLQVYGMNNISQLVTAVNAAFVVKADGTLWSFGFNGNTGQLGLGPADIRVPTVVPVGDGEKVKQIVNTNYHTMVLTTTFRLYTWGKNEYGQLGVDEDLIVSSISTPRRLLADTEVSQIAVGTNHSLAVNYVGQLYAWGRNHHGQLGDGTTTDQMTPKYIMTNVVTVAAGGDSTAVIKRDGSLWVSGAEGFTKRMDKGVKQVVVADRIYAITSNNELWIAGATASAKLMDDVKQVKANGSVAFAIKTDGTLWDISIGVVPKRLLTNVTSVSTSGTHHLALRKDGSLWAWGKNDQAQLGDGHHYDETEPKLIDIDETSATEAPSGNIEFADATVKHLCVGNWDTDRDKELTKEEAALVRNLGTIFYGQSTITSFNELKYFTALTYIAEEAFAGCSAMKSVTLPNTIIYIDCGAFSGCSSLTSITIPSSVCYIDSRAFYDCHALSEVYNLVEEPFDISDDVFQHYVGGQDVFTDATLYVPAGTKKKYMEANGWKRFKNIVEIGGTPEPPVVKPGDVNGDGEVNVGDIMAVVNYMAGQAEGIDKDVADVNGDGEVNVGDIMAIINIMAS